MQWYSFSISGTSIHELVGWVQIYIILQNTDSCEQVYRHVVVSLNGNNLRQILGHVAMWKGSLPQTLFQLNVFCWNELGSSHMALHVASVAMPHEVVSIWRPEKTAVLVPKIWKGICITDSKTMKSKEVKVISCSCYISWSYKGFVLNFFLLRVISFWKDLYIGK